MKDPSPDVARVRNEIRTALPGMLVALAMIVGACTSRVPVASLDGSTSGSESSPTNPTSTASVEQTMASSALPSLSPSPSPSPTPTPSPSPSPTPIVREASAVAHIPHCQDALGWDYELSGNDFYVVCAGTDEGPGPNSVAAGPYVARVNLSTNKVTATYRYKTPMTYIESIAIAGGSLWFEGIFGGSACSESKPGECDGWRRIERYDLATGKNTMELRNLQLLGSAFGFVWVQDTAYSSGGQTPYLRKLDPATGREKARIPFSMDFPIFACGSLWGWSMSNYAAADTNTTLARIDPANGNILARFTEPGLLAGLQAVGEECWASAAPGGPDFDIAGYADRFVRIGDTGIESRGPQFPAGIVRHADPQAPSPAEVWESYVASQGGVFWLVRADLGPNVSMQRLDPVTWQLSGTVWRWSGDTPQGSPFVIVDGSVWAYDNQGGIARLDIPVGEP